MKFSALFGLTLLACLTSARAADSVVVFNEINYHPKDTASGTEWIELRNLMGVNVDMSGWRLSSGVDFVFPQGTVIPGHGFLLVAAQPGHPTLAGKNALGPFSGSLNNSRETVRLRNNNDRILDEVNYEDDGDWPVGADGSGSTLAKRHQETADARPSNWTASPELGGTPGAPNFPLASAPPVVTALAALDDEWKYYDGASAPAANWQAADFDDGGWATGEAVLHAGGAEISGVGDGLLAWWALNETSGATVSNQVAGGPSGMLVSGGTWVNDATRGRVLSLTGSGDYAALGDTTIPVMTLQNDFTWAFWSNTSSAGSTDVILGNRYNPSGSEWNPREFIKFTPAAFEFHRNGAGENLDYADIPANTWLHHAVVKSGSTLAYYRNGSAAGSATITQPLNNPQPLYLGGDRASENWNGRLDDVALWTKALPAASVAGLANGTFTPLTAPTDGTGGGSLGTELAVRPAHYFRKKFTFTGSPAQVSLSLRHLADDGAVFYLNGIELHRFNMPEGAITHTTAAAVEVGDAALSSPVALPATALRQGENVLAVQVCQAAASPADMAFGLSLTATTLPASAEEPGPGLVINELSGVFSEHGGLRVELANLSSAPISLEGHALASSDVGFHALPAVTLAPGALHVEDLGGVNFSLALEDRLFLLGPGGQTLIDARARADRLQGLVGGRWGFPSAETFGAPNIAGLNTDVVINEIMYNPRALEAVDGTPPTVQSTVLLGWNAPWRYNATGADLGDAWETAAHPPGAGWQEGPGPLGYETSPGVPSNALNTQLPPPAGNTPYIVTYYFETEFTLTPAHLNAISSLRLTHEIDDGAIFYLNGQPVLRYGMPDEPVTAATLSTLGSDATLTGPVTLEGARALLVAGANRLSVEVHQNSIGSSDVVFGMMLEAVETIAPGTPAQPFRNSDEQWLELHNRGTAAADLSGWSFTDGINFTFPASTVIAPGGYLVLARQPASLAAKYPGIALTGPFDGNLSRSGERLRLLDSAGNLADEVRYADGRRWPGKADGSGSSLELRDPRADNGQPGAWAASDESARTSWQTYTYTLPAANGQADPTLYNEFIFGLLDEGEILIDDISVIENPGGSARQLIQNGTFDTGTSAWRFLGTHRHATVVDDPGAPGNKVLHLQASGASEHMHNHAETTLKFGGSFVTINSSLSYQISYRARWLSGSNQLNTRLYFNRAARTTKLAAFQDGGTPGKVNSTRAANVGPTLSGLKHAPAVPAADEPATVFVTALDPDGVGGVTLHYAVNGGAFATAAMSPLGGGRYSGTVPGQAAGAKVQFYVSATDAAAATAFEPADGPDSRALIPWDDGQARLTLGSVQPNNLRLVMTTADANFMHTPAQVMSNDRLGCTVIYNETDVYYDCGIRLKGSQRGRPKDVRVGFTVGFPSDQPFLGAHGTIAVDRSGSGDQFSQKEILIKHAISRAGGIPGMYDDLIRVIAPRSAHTGSAILLKSRFDDEWLDNQFEEGGDGQMFEYELIYYPTTTSGGTPEGLKLPEPDDVRGVSVRTLGSLDKERYRWHWLIDNNRDADNYAGLIKMLQVFGLSGAAYREQIDQVIDVDQWLRAFAIQTLFGVGDSYSSGSQHNLLIYFRPDDGRAMYFPWDMDFTFSMGATDGVVNNGDLSNMLNSHPSRRRAYYAHLHDLLTTTFNATYMQPWAAHYSQFLPSENLTGYVSYINTRRNHVLGLINSAVPATAYAITTPDGAATDQSTATIQGTGWVDLAEIRLASTGAALPLIWTSATAWQVLAPVVPGSNALTLQAYNAQGGLIGSGSVTINATGQILPAKADNLAISEMMYHPLPPTAEEQAAGFTDKEDFEFIELANLNATAAISLNNVRFTNGIAHTFGAAQIAPGGRVVLARNPAAFAARYGAGIALPDGYGSSSSPSLNNSGETVEITAADGFQITSFTYSDSAPWPVQCDGEGYSLTLLHPGLRHAASAESWRTSAQIGGSPGWDDREPLAAWQATHGITDLTSDDDRDGLPALLEYFIGTSPNHPDATPHARIEPALGSADLAFNAIFRHKVGRDDVIYAPQTSRSLADWQYGLPAYLLDRRTLEDGTEEVIYRLAAPLPEWPSVYVRMHAEAMKFE